MSARTVSDLPETRRDLQSEISATRSTRALALAYLLPVALSLVAVQTWFRPGTVIAGGDAAPLFRSGTSYLSHWNPVLSGEGAPSFTIVQLPYLEAERLASALGVSSGIFQRVLISLLFAGAAACVVYYAFGLIEDPIVAGLAGLFASFNPYRLVTAADPISLAAVCAAALLGGLILRIGRSRDESRRVMWFGLCSMNVGYVMVNPPHVALVAVWVLTSAVFGALIRGRRYLVAALRFFLKALPLAVLLNLWWIVPVVLTFRAPGFGSRFAAGDSQAWAWTHARASLTNAFAMNTSWGWGHPEYFPFAGGLDQGALGVLRFVLPSLALVGLVRNLRTRTRLVLSLGVAWGVTLWIAKGYHAPLGGTNAWLYEHLPGFWLLRDPAKVMTLTLMVVAILAGLGIAELLRPQRRSRRWAYAFGAVLVVGSLAYLRPLFTGALIPDERPLLPSAHVVVPDAWRKAADYLDSLPTGGKVLVLPVADYYQLPTTWGYYGTTFTGWLVDKPVIEPTPGAYFTNFGSGSRLVGSAEDALLDGGGADRTLPLLRALGVRYVLLRRDLDLSFPGRHLSDPAAIARGLVATRGIVHLRSFGLLDVYGVTAPPSAEVVAAKPFVYEGPTSAIPHVLTVLPSGAALVSGGPDRAEQGTSVFSAGGEVTLIRAEDQHLYQLEARSSEGWILLRLTDPLAVSVAGRPLPPLSAQLFRFEESRSPEVLSIGAERLVLRDLTRAWSDLGLVRLAGPAVIRLASLAQPPPVDLGSAGPVGHCNRYDDRTPQEVGLSSAIVEQNGVRTLRLAASDHAACVSFPIRPFEPAATYEISFEYRSVQGSPARVCALESPLERCFPLPALEADHGWHRFQATVRPDASSNALHLVMYADGTGSGQTVAEYRRVAAVAAAPVQVVAVKGMGVAPRPDVAFTVVSPSEVHVRVSGASGPAFLVLAEAYASGWVLSAPGHDVGEVRHVLVNGYSNGWLIPWKGSYELTMSYRPERLAHAARVIDLVLIPVVLMAALFGRRRRASHRRRRLRFRSRHDRLPSGCELGEP